MKLQDCFQHIFVSTFCTTVFPDNPLIFPCLAQIMWFRQTGFSCHVKVIAHASMHGIPSDSTRAHCHLFSAPIKAVFLHQKSRDFSKYGYAGIVCQMMVTSRDCSLKNSRRIFRGRSTASEKPRTIVSGP